jgi:hypothetical protein
MPTYWFRVLLLVIGTSVSFSACFLLGDYCESRSKTRGVLFGLSKIVHIPGILSFLCLVCWLMIPICLEVADCHPYQSQQDALNFGAKVNSPENRLINMIMLGIILIIPVAVAAGLVVAGTTIAISFLPRLFLDFILRNTKRK